MNHPPPPVLVDGDVGRVEHAGRVETGQRHQVQRQHAGNAGPAAFREGGCDVVEEHQHHGDDADVGPARRLDVFTALVDQPASSVVAGAGLHQQIDQHDDGDGPGQHPEGDVAELEADDLDAALVLQEPVNRADKAVQHPNHHGVDVHHAVDAEIEQPEQKVRPDELEPGQQAEQQLGDEQDHRRREILHGQLLAAIEIIGIQRGAYRESRFHERCRRVHAHSCAVSVLKLWGKPLVSMVDIHLRKATTPWASSSVMSSCGMRRPLP